MNGSIASANNATLATVAANYGLKTVVDQHSLDIAARITPLEVDTKVANALLGAVTAAALASELASRDASISGLQASKADASALTAYALQSSVDTSSEVDSKIAAALLGAVTTAALDAALAGKADASALAALLSTVDGLPLEVDTKIANALLGLATEAAQLASRDASITALQASKADATLLASYATNAALSASETALQSALDAILAELAALQLSGGVVNAPAWAGFTTWELLRGSSVVRNLHFVAPLSAALANGDDTLSITADCYSTAGTDAAIAAQVDTLLGDYRTGTAQDAETAGAITAALLAYYTAASGRAVGRLPHGERAGHADAGRHRGRAAGLPDGPGPGRLHNQPNHLGAGGVPLSRRPGHGDGLEHRRRAAQLLHHRTSRRPPCGQARNHGGGLCAADSSALSGRRRGRRGGGRHRRADPGPHGRLAVKLDGSPQQRLRGRGHAHRGSERGRLHANPGGEPVEHRAHLQLVLCKGACSAKESTLQRSVLCRGECCAEKSALQRSVLCKEACSAKKRALQRSVLCREECLQRSVLCKGACSAKKRALQRSSVEESALQRRVLCKEACSERSVLCRGACSAKKRALQRSVLLLCRGACSACCAEETLPLLCRARFFAQRAPASREHVLCKEACRARSAEHASLQSRARCFARACSAKKRALNPWSVLCKEAAKKRALQGACSEESALQRSVLCRRRSVLCSVLCRGACSAKKRVQRSVLCKAEEARTSCCATASLQSRGGAYVLLRNSFSEKWGSFAQQRPLALSSVRRLQPPCNVTVRRQDALAHLRALPCLAHQCIYADPPYIFPGRSMNYYGTRGGHDRLSLRDALFASGPCPLS